MPGRVEGKVVLITGGGSSKGQELAELLVAEGARVIVTDIDGERAAKVAESVGKPNRVRSLELDVSNVGHWENAVVDVQANEGRLDVLVNSARADRFRGLVTDMTLDDWQMTTRVDMDGPFLGAKHFLPMLAESGAGNIVNIVSLTSVQPNAHTPAYAAAAAAVVNFTHTLALQWAEENVRANSVVVGFSANSPMDNVHALAKKLIPLGRPNSGADIARAVLWLMSDEAAYVTGTELKLDGGRSAGLKTK